MIIIKKTRFSDSIGALGEAEHEYSNRARYKLGFTHPLNGDAIAPGTNFLSVFNEIFVDFDQGDYWFDLEGNTGLNQNRLYAGWGYPLTDLSGFQLGLSVAASPQSRFLATGAGLLAQFRFALKFPTRQSRK